VKVFGFPRHDPAPRLYRAVVVFLKWLVWLSRWRVRFVGLEHIPEHGPVVIVANHISYLDPILIGLGVERRGRMVRYLAKRELFDHWFTGPVMRGADQILVDRKGDAGAALRHAEAAMAQGKLLVIFPQGTIRPTFDPSQGKTGAARLALACGVPLVPAVAWGGQQIATKHQPRRSGWRTHHEVHFGPAITAGPDDSAADLTLALMNAIGDLLRDAAAAHPRDLGPTFAEAS